MSRARIRCTTLYLAMAATLSAFTLAACAKDPVRPSMAPVQWGTGNADIALAWSRDGQWIAFRRMLPSSYGPPGMYVVHRTGSAVRYIYGPADLFFPREASFSPDGRFIAAVDIGRQLIIVDLVTLEVRRPLYPQGEIESPDWSPDGHTILYSQFYDGRISTPDSLGLFLLDVATGERRPLRWGPDPVYSFYPRWSPDGSLIAMDELVGPSPALAVINSDGTYHRILIPPESHQVISNVDWYRTPGQPARILFYRTPEPGAGPFLINPDGTGFTPFWHHMLPEAFLSPSGLEYVRRRPDPVSHWWVLYIGLVNDMTDVAMRQLTRYEPLISAAVDTPSGGRHEVAPGQPAYPAPK